MFRVVLAVMAAATVAACGGGGGGSSAPPVPVPTVTPTAPPSSTQSIAVGSAASTFALPQIAAGFAASGTLPAATSGSGTLTATLTVTNPSSVAPAAMRRAPSAIGAQSGQVGALAYVSLTTSATVTLPGVPSFTFTVPSGTAAPNGFWLAVLDTSQPSQGWTVLGKASSSTATTVTFPAASQPITLNANVPYVVLLFAPGGTYPTPAPSPTATPVSSCSSTQRGSSGVRRLAAAANGGVVPNRFYVTYRSGMRAAQSAGGIAVLRSTDAGSDARGVHRFVTLAGDDATRNAAALRGDPNVVDVAPVHYRSASSDAVANDPLLDNYREWYLYKTNVADAAWTTTHGTGITVAVIDTGVDETNQDLAPKLDLHESIINGTVTNDAQDTDGHGTNVAGLVAAQPNNGYGFAGVGWDVHLLVYKIFPDSTPSCESPNANTADEATAIRAATDAGASVISISLGGPQSAGADQGEQDAVAYAIAHNVTVVAAAGNEYPTADGNQPDFPAAYPSVIAVGASAVQDSQANTYSSITAETIASYSNSGATVVAPGGDATGTTDNDYLHWITGYSTMTAGYPADRCHASIPGDPAYGGVCITLFNGTSQATPQVSGLVALMEAKHGGQRSLTPTQVQSILTSTAHQIPGIPAARQGAGRIDAAAALAQS